MGYLILIFKRQSLLGFVKFVAETENWWLRWSVEDLMEKVNELGGQRFGIWWSS